MGALLGMLLRRLLDLPGAQVGLTVSASIPVAVIAIRAVPPQRRSGDGTFIADRRPASAASDRRLGTRSTRRSLDPRMVDV